MKTKLSTMACSQIAMAIQSETGGKMCGVGVHGILTRSKKPTDDKVNLALTKVRNLEFKASGFTSNGTDPEAVKWWGVKVHGPNGRGVNVTVVRIFDPSEQKVLYEVKPGKLAP